MRRLLALLWLGGVALGVAGCGPLQMPMALRPDADGQKAIDEAWDRVLQPVDRFDHQALLDILMGTGAYEAGVDTLTFRSEKRTAAGTVVMEVHYDRQAPEQDRFEVTVLGRDGVVRHEGYNREEVEKTYGALFGEYEFLRQRQAQGMATPEEARKLADYEARRKVIEGVFPKFGEKRPPERGAEAAGR